MHASRRLRSPLALALAAALLLGEAVGAPARPAPSSLPSVRGAPGRPHALGAPGAGLVGSASRRTKLLVAWSPAQLPRRTAGALERMRGVKATTVLTGLVWMKRSHTHSGRVLERPRPGYAIPLDVAFVKPRRYRAFVPGSAPVGRLRHRKAVLSRAGAALRGSHPRLRMRLVGGARRSSLGVIRNGPAQGYEAIMARPAPRGTATLRSVLIRKRLSVPRRRIKRRIRRLLGDGEPLRLASQSDTRHLRYADQTRSQAAIKRRFGEFAARPSGAGAVDFAGRWAARHISARRLPLLGRVTCHRKLFSQLRGAMRELRRKGLSRMVRREEYAGCFNPRFIAGGARRLSRHTWGIAVDLNTSGNAFGEKPHQPRRLVRIMRKWGFTWGGRWPLPDGMHFEWLRS